MDYFDRCRKRDAIEQAEKNGKVADSIDVRKALMERIKDGEITLEEAQTELKKIKRNAKKNGQTTRNRAFLNG